MKVLYHFTFLPPERPACVAEVQEVEALRRHFGCRVIYLNPNGRSPIYVPRALFGFHKLVEVKRQESETRLHHVYNADAFAFPVLRLFRRPIVYSISGGIGERRPNIRFLNGLAAVAVADEQSLRRLEAWGARNVLRVRAGIDTARFRFSPLPLRSEIVLMVGSAPWTRDQFDTKGVTALLETARRSSRLRLVFLWRGVLGDEMERRVRRMDLEERVQVLDRHVDVNQVLAQVHASIVLAAAPGIVKAYPHSLMESLSAGKPVLISRAIPMAKDVKRSDCGLVLESLDPEELLATIDILIRRYDRLQEAALTVGQRDFTLEKMLASFQRVYERVL